MALQLFKIASTTVETPQASIDFTSIPQGYTDLIVKSSARTDSVNNVQILNVTFNNDTAANYSARTLYALNSNAPASTSASGDTKIQWAGYSVGNSATANTFSNYEFYIPNYTGSNSKSVSADVVTENNSLNNILLLTAGVWSGTSAINRITITPVSGIFMANTTATLYGVL